MSETVLSPNPDQILRSEMHPLRVYWAGLIGALAQCQRPIAANK